MSYLDKYNELKRKRKQEEDENNTSKSNSPYLAEYNRLKEQRETSQPTVTLGDVFDRVGYSSIGMQSLLNGRTPSSILSQDQEEEDERRWFEKGSDNVFKAILGTASDTVEELNKGIVGLGEKAIDFGASLYPYASSAVRNIWDDRTYKEILEEEQAKADEFIAKDTINEEAVARTILSVLPTANVMMQGINGGVINPVSLVKAIRQRPEIMDYLENDMEADSVLGEKSEALVQSAGQLAAQYGLQSVGVPWFVTSSITSFGGEMENALKQGATHEQAMGSAAVTAGAEVLSEKLFGGDLFTHKAGTDLASKWLATNVSNKAWRTFLKFTGDTAGEGLEEVFSEFMGNLGSKLYREESLGEILFNEEALDGYLESAIGGWVLGGGMSGINVASSAKTGTDYTTGLTANEQKVVETLYNEQVAEESKKGDVSQKRKNELFESLIEDMKKGRISTDDIERILGGDAYKAYQDTVSNEDAIRKEFEELGQKQNATLAEQARYAELGQQVKDIDANSNRNQLKSQLGETVFGLVKGDRLVESYNERSRRGQAFEADLTQYDEGQRATIQNAINSGILNNTRRSHEFVELVAKISADKGIAFDFTNNEKLKGTSFAVEGKTVNGFKTNDGITINTNSKKALETVVGHEISHVLEGTEFYDAMKETLFNYAKSKGEYDGRLNALRDVYKDVDGYKGKDFDTLVENELAADLVGDYLFTDTDFVSRLSVENRNVFQKMWDEIKYLCKVVTAGSKEARELERVKKAFEDAYRADGKSSGDTKFSLSDSDGRQLSEGQQKYFADSKVRDENQIKSVANENPTADPDIRYSLSEPIADAQNERGLDTKSEVQFSLSNDTAYMDKAIAANESMHRVDGKVLADAKTLRERIAARMNDIKDRGLVGLPEDIEGNTYIANSSYDGTEENTTICPRSLASEAFVDAVSEYLGRPLSVEEQIYISQDLQGRSLTPECTYCYVATDRKAYRAFLGEYISQRDTVLQKVQDNPNADVSRSGELYQEFLNGRKDTNPMYSRFKMWVDAYKNGKPLIDASHLANMSKLMGDINSEFGAELKPQIVDAMKYAQSASWAKKRVNYVAYNGHILKWKQNRIDKLNGHYGLRMYSFSDFHPAFVLENMQMITDASVRGLKMLGYTKDTDFVEIFAPSGMNINVSTFGFESGGNVYENNLIGAEWEKAKALRDQYPNVGITFVATNDTLVDWALEQDWIDVVIPFHLVRTGKEVAKAFNYHDYTSESSDVKTKDWKKGDKKYIAPTEHNNDKATYLAALDANHLKPRFERFIDRQNYMKLVNECRQPASKSKPVQPVFNEDAAMVALAKLEANGYYQPIGGSVDRMYEIAAEVAENMTNQVAPVQRSLSVDGEEYSTNGKYFGKDMAYAPVQEVAPVQETVAENTEAEALADDVAPMMETAPAEVSAKTEAIEPTVEETLSMEETDAPINESANAKVYPIGTVVHAADRGNYGRVVAYDEASNTYAVSFKSKNGSTATVRLSADQVYAPTTDTSTAREAVEAKLRSLEVEIENNRRLRSESAEGYDSEIADLRAEYDAKKNKNTQVANGILRRIERLQRMKASTDAEYAKRISDLAQRANKLNEDIESGQAIRGEQKKRKHEEYFNLIKDLVGDTSTWADKKLGIAYKVNTLRRNLRDIVRDAKGKKDVAKADAIWDELQGKYNQHEAERNKEVNALVDQFSKHKITSAEDTYIQMLGELRHNPETTLTEEDVQAFYEEHKKHINTQKVDRVIAEARSMYDTLLERLNEVLREQGMKEIPRREGYFPHFKDEKQGLLGKLLNWKTQNNEIPTDIAGLTETFNPTRSWQSFNKHRMSDVTDYSFTKGFDSYVGGALDWVYHIEDIQKRRAFENYIRYVHSEKGVQEMIDKIVNNPEYDADTTQQMIDGIRAEASNPLNNFVTDFRTGTNTLAGKKSSLDRTAEALTNRKIYSTMTNLSNRVSANMVGGSVSSALTNFIPITQSWMEVDPKYSVVAMRDTIRSAISDDGTIEKSSFLTNRLRSAEKLHQTTWDKISDKVGIMMDAIDGFTANTVWRSKYLQNLDNGMSESEAIKKADEFAANVMADRSRGNQPTIFDSKNPLIKAFTAFQLEVNNQYGYMFKDAPTDLKQEGTGKLIKGYATAFVGAYVYNALYSTLTGRDAAFDPVSIVLDLMRDLGWIGDEDDEEENPLDAIWNFAENVAEEIPFIAPFTGGGRIPISSAIPYDGLIKAITGTVTDISEGNWKNLTNEWLNPVYYLLPPVGGGQIRKSVQGLSMFDDDHPIAGSYTTSGSLRYSVEDTPWNRVQAGIFGQWANENAQTYIDQNKRPLSAQGLQELMDLDVPMDEYWTLQNTYKRVTEEAKAEGATDEQILSARYISSVGSQLSSLQNVKESLELGLTPEGDAYDDLRKEYGNMLPDDVCAEMLEEVESRMDELANERADSYTDVTIDGEYAQVGSLYFKQDDDGDWSKMSDEQTTKYLVTRDAGDSKYADDGTNFYRKDDEGEWHKMGEDEVTKYVTVRAAGDAHYATNGEVHYRLEEGGDWQDPSDWTKISDKQLERQIEVTSALGITPEEYWANTDISFIPMAKGEYEYAYDNPENYTVAKAVGGYDAYKSYSSAMNEIKADKDENGKSISGSRKEKIWDYISGLDCDDGMKYILFKSEYTADDTYNYDIVRYLNEREDISYEDMETILKELGFDVDAKGNVTW